MHDGRDVDDARLWRPQQQRQQPHRQVGGAHDVDLHSHSPSWVHMTRTMSMSTTTRLSQPRVWLGASVQVGAVCQGELVQQLSGNVAVVCTGSIQDQHNQAKSTQNQLS
jgi:hypothetical protein